MKRNTESRASFAAAVALSCVLCGCLPLKDLSKAAGGRSGSSADAAAGSTGPEGGTDGGIGGLSASSTSQGGSTGGAAGSTVASSQGGAGSGGTTAEGGTSTRSEAGATAGRTSTRTAGAGGRSSSAGSVAGGSVGQTTSGGVGGTSLQGGTGGSGGSGGVGGTTDTAAPDLPDIVNSPVKGQITYSAGASWSIDGEQWPAFEIHTPTASYWLVKSAAAIASITDSAGVQWINYSSYRSECGVPNMVFPNQGGCCQPGNPEKLGLPMMTTEIDPSFTVTSTHLRLVSKSATGSYWLVWDFFLTHFTLTVNRADKPFGFTYRGVPGGNIDTRDELVLCSGETLSASDPYTGALPGPEPWAYYNRPMNKRALFLIQHSADALVDSYQVADGDNAMWTFGGDGSKRTITQTPIRFSLGVMDSSDHAPIVERIQFVLGAIN